MPLSIRTEFLEGGIYCMDTAQVLLVDDDPVLLQALSRAIALCMSAVTVQTTRSAHEALNFLAEQTYGAIVSDIEMPEMDGLALLAHLQDRHVEVPVLLITAQGDHRRALRALEGGAYDYILKPIDRDDFIAALHRALYTHRLQQQIEKQQRVLERSALSLERLVGQRTRSLAEASSARETLLRGMIAELCSLLANLEALVQRIACDMPRGATMGPVRDEVAQLQQVIGQVQHKVGEVESSLQATPFA